MAILSDAEREAIRQDWTRLAMDIRETTSLLKSEVFAAAGALDAWVDANAAAVNAAIPQPARTAMTAKQKAALFMIVLQRRYGAEV